MHCDRISAESAVIMPSLGGLSSSAIQIILITVRDPLQAMACIFFTPFQKTISLFLRRFFQKSLSLCTASNQERLMMVGVYGISS